MPTMTQTGKAEAIRAPAPENAKTITTNTVAGKATYTIPGGRKAWLLTTPEYDNSPTYSSYKGSPINRTLRRSLR